VFRIFFDIYHVPCFERVKRGPTGFARAIARANYST